MVEEQPICVRYYSRGRLRDDTKELVDAAASNLISNRVPVPVVLIALPSSQCCRPKQKDEETRPSVETGLPMERKEKDLIDFWESLIKDLMQ